MDNPSIINTILNIFNTPFITPSPDSVAVYHPALSLHRQPMARRTAGTRVQIPVRALAGRHKNGPVAQLGFRALAF